jgi:peptidoglycan hydrolase-like protein with peptidoglycan-binding domain
MLNAEQIAWLQKTKEMAGGFGGGGASAPRQTAESPSAVPKTAPSNVSVSRITVANKSGLTLTLDFDDEVNGQFRTRPPRSLPPGAVAQFVFAANPAEPGGSMEAGMVWSLGTSQMGAAGLGTWAIHWSIPTSGEGQATARFLETADESSFRSAVATRRGSDGSADITFTLEGAARAPATAGQNCSVTFVNQTDRTLIRLTSREIAGTFRTQPPERLAPGASASFAFAADPDAPTDGIDGMVQWSVGNGAIDTNPMWQVRWIMGTGPGAGNDVSERLGGPDTTALKSSHNVTGDPGGNSAIVFTLTDTGAARGGADVHPATTANAYKIQVTNNSDTELTLADVSMSGGESRPPPPAKLAASETWSVEFVPGPASSDCTIAWHAGDPKAAGWNVQWMVDEAGRFKVDGFLDTTDAGLTSSVTSGSDGKTVHVEFVLTGKLAPRPAQPNSAFQPPAQSKQPTLRIGDESPDGWVDYAQWLLNEWRHKNRKPPLPENGKFDRGMEVAVVDFQKAANCQPDGVIGNQTWSALRDAPTRDQIGTDGRQPHTFEQKGAQARFLTEGPGDASFMVKDDRLDIVIVSVGEHPIDDYKVTVRVTQPDGTAHTHEVPMGEGNPLSAEGRGNIYSPFIANFHRTFSIGDNVDPDAWQIEAYLPEALGGDRWSGPLRVVGRAENRPRPSSAPSGDHDGGRDVPPEAAGPDSEPPPIF